MADAPTKLYYFFLFDRSGRLLLSRTWDAADGRGKEGAAQDESRAKLVYGMLFSLKYLAPSLVAPDAAPTEEGIRSFSTRTCTLHAYESPTGFRLALCTGVSSQRKQAEAQALLAKVYQEFVDLIVRDPTYTPHPPQPVTSPVFLARLDKTLMG